MVLVIYKKAKAFANFSPALLQPWKKEMKRNHTTLKALQWELLTEFGNDDGLFYPGLKQPRLKLANAFGVNSDCTSTRPLTTLEVFQRTL